MIAALQVSLDGFTQGSDQAGPEWVDSWADAIQLIPDVDAFVQGTGMYPARAQAQALESCDTVVPKRRSMPPTRLHTRGRQRGRDPGRNAAEAPAMALANTSEPPAGGEAAANLGARRGSLPARDDRGVRFLRRGVDGIRRGMEPDSPIVAPADVPFPIRGWIFRRACAISLRPAGGLNLPMRPFPGSRSTSLSTRRCGGL